MRAAEPGFFHFFSVRLAIRHQPGVRTKGRCRGEAMHTFVTEHSHRFLCCHAELFGHGAVCVDDFVVAVDNANQVWHRIKRPLPVILRLDELERIPVPLGDVANGSGQANNFPGSIGLGLRLDVAELFLTVHNQPQIHIHRCPGL